MDPTQLKKIPLFANLTNEHLAKVAAIAAAREFKANEKIFSEGDVGSYRLDVVAVIESTPTDSAAASGRSP